MRAQTWVEFLEMAKQINPNWNEIIYFYIEGSQGIPTGEESHSIREFNSVGEICDAFRFFIDDHVAGCGYEDYVDDCDGDDEEGFMEACADTGAHIICSISPSMNNDILDNMKYVDIHLEDID